MSHRMTMEDRLTVVGGSVWHRFNVELGENAGHAEYFTAGGCDWASGLYPLAAIVGLNDDGSPILAEVPDTFASCRENPDGTVRAFPGSVGKQYRAFQPRVVHDLFDPFVNDGLVTPETVGTYDSGAVMFASYRCSSDTEIKLADGSIDVHERFLAVQLGFTGRVGFSIYPTDTRPVCNNTSAYGLKAARHRITSRHSGDVAAKADEMADLLAQCFDVFEARQRAMQALADQPVRSAQTVSQWAASLLERIDGALTDPREIKGDSPEAEKARVKADRAIEARTEAVRDITTRFRDGKGNRGESAYDVYNGFTEWYDHARSAKRKARDADQLAERHLKALVFDDGKSGALAHKAAAMTSLRELVPA